MIKKVILVLSLLAASLAGCRAAFSPTTSPTQALPAAAPLASQSTSLSKPGEIYDTISKDSLLGYIEKLSAIQPYSGWRTSGTQGEAQALDYVTSVLGEFPYLKKLGLELERQNFHIFNTTEQWENSLVLTIAGKQVEVPANGMRGSRYDLKLTLRFDSDGKLNDSDSNPLTADGAVVLVRSLKDAEGLKREEVMGKLAFVDYAALDRIALQNEQSPYQLVARLFELRPGGIVLVTHNSNKPGESHGTFVGDSNAFINAETSQNTPVIPILYTRLEDLSTVGINSWNDMKKIEKAYMLWDADVFSPATSGNLSARIPGSDSSKVMILSAHIDSANTPGAMDDGSGSAVLLEVARVLDSAQVQPPVDLYLVWYGSEEVALWGSSYFIATHQDLLDRALAMLQTDMLSHPLDGLGAEIYLNSWVYSEPENNPGSWVDYLREQTASLGIRVFNGSSAYVNSDNWGYTGFNVPNANMIYMSPEMEALGSLHYATHIHDPYDTVEQVSQESDVLVNMARVALTAGLETGQDKPELRSNPNTEHRALFIASHTEALSMSPVGFTEVGQVLAAKGFDVDMLPYGQPVTSKDLEKTDLVVALPVIDLLSQEIDLSLYDDNWSEAEITVLEDYVARGGCLVLMNSAHRVGFVGGVFETNEDWEKINALAERFGVQYHTGNLKETIATPEKNGNPLMKEVVYLEIMEGNAIPFTMKTGESLAKSNGQTVVGLVHYGDRGGEVIILADLGIMYFAKMGTPYNQPFWQNLADYARSR
jgi:hypothetical protein